MDYINDELGLQATKSEYTRVKLFIAALTICLIIMGYLFFVMDEVTSFFSNRYTPNLVVGWILIYILYEFIALIIVRYYYKKLSTVPRAFQFGNVVIESVLPGILFFTLCAVEWSPIFLDSPLIFTYFILITLSILYLDPILSFLTGMVSAVGYFGVTIWAINTFDPEMEVLDFPLLLYVVRSTLIFLVGLCATFLAAEMSNRIKKSIKLTQEKGQIELLFGQQVSKNIVNALVKDQNSSKRMEVSIMFLDIRNFSSFAELRDPREVITFQNNIFSPLMEIISNHNGIINQILGDGFMATFGAPLKDDNHALNGLEAGFEILQKLKELATLGVIPETRVGIGLHTGEVIAGNIGNESRKQYSISGSPVIIAARLEQLNKKHNSQFLISKELFDKVAVKKINFMPMGKMNVKNIARPIEVFKAA